MIGFLKSRLRRLRYAPIRWLRTRVEKSPAPLIRLGTHYGGWTVLADETLEGNYAILCGAGEDVSFDIALVQRFGGHALVVDPTPRAIAHFEKLKSTPRGHAAVPSGDPRSAYYNGADEALEQITFIPVAAWSETTVLKFWKPKNEEHVSHSATNIQNTDSYIEVPAKTLLDIVSEIGVDIGQVSLLKLDIEGSEFEVISWCLRNGVLPKQLLVEFDELNFSISSTSSEIKSVVSELLKTYRLEYFDGDSSCLFVRRS